MTMQELMDSMAGFAKKHFEESGELLPMWTLVDKEGNQSVFLTPFSNNEEKDMTSVLIRQQVQKLGAVMIGFMSETWTVQVNTKKEKVTPLKFNSDNLPEEYHDLSVHPDRMECIYLTVEVAHGGSITGSIKINRDEKGNGTLDEYQQVAFTSTSGRFANMFPKATVN